jgi:hypothetical protein
MSITVDYCFNASEPIDQLAERINGVVGCSLIQSAEDPAVYNGILYAIPLVLIEHTFVNDRDLNFEDYRYSIWLKTWVPQSDLRAIQVEAVAMIAFVLHMRLGIHEGLLTFDGQVPLARYGRKGDEEWWDILSGTAVSYPEHLQQLHSRAWTGRRGNPSPAADQGDSKPSDRS